MRELQFTADAVGQPAARARFATSGYGAAVCALMLGDLLCLALGLITAYRLRFCTDFGPSLRCLGLPASPGHLGFYGQMALLQVGIAFVALWGQRAYARETVHHGLAQYAICAKAVSVTALTAVFGSYFVDSRATLSRGYLLLGCGACVVLLCAFRAFARHTFHALHERGHLMERAVIVGTSTEAQMLEWMLHQRPYLGYQVVGFIGAEPPGTPVQAGLAVLGPIGALREVVRSHGIERIFIARSSLSQEATLDALEHAVGTAAQVAVSPDYFQVLATESHLLTLPGIPLITVGKARLTGGHWLGKLAFDLGVSLVLLIVLAPLLAVLALMIRWRLGPPILDRVPAIGPRGRRFYALKFRTTEGGERAALNDPRVAERLRKGLPVREFPSVTPLGRVLRTYSLDELPQLINVLRGEMSIVGPYKIHPDQLALYGRRWLLVTAMKPGITGICQVSGRGELTPSERAVLDADYVRHYSLWHDVVLLARTFRAMLRGHGAY